MLINNKDPLLHRPSEKVSEEERSNHCKQLQPILGLMADILDKNQALGISACQIGFDKAMFIIDVNGERRVCINPEIVAANLQMSLFKEGCLSFPGLNLVVRRPAAVAVRYFNHYGKEITEKLEELTARVWLHEFDHLNGICFTDRVGKLKFDMALKKQAKRNKK